MKEQKILDSRPVTERIKTFDDALANLEYMSKKMGNQWARYLCEEWYSVVNMAYVDETKLYLQLKVITYALNEGQKAPYGRQVYPYFILRPASMVLRMSEKKKEKFHLWIGEDGSGFGIAPTRLCSDVNLLGPGLSRGLAFRYKKIAEYAGEQFAAMYAVYFLGKGAKPWREFEKGINK